MFFPFFFFFFPSAFVSACLLYARLTTKIRFEAFDEPWKIQFNTEDEAWEDKWGLMDSARKLKPGLKIPDCDGKTV